MIDINVNFKGGAPGQILVSDFAFVKDPSRNILVLASYTDNEVVLVDFDNNFRTKRLNLSPSSSESTGGSARKVEWAIGTNYVWVDGATSKEQYIIDVSTGVEGAKIVRTIQFAGAGSMIFVNNYKRLRDVELMEQIASDKQSITHINQEKSFTNSASGAGSAGLVIGCIALVGVSVLAAYVLTSSKRQRSTSSKSGTDDGHFDDEQMVGY